MDCLDIILAIGNNLVVTVVSKNMYELKTDKKILLTIFNEV